MSDRVMSMSSGEAVMSEGPNYYYENKEYLYKIIKKQLGITKVYFTLLYWLHGMCIL